MRNMAAVGAAAIILAGAAPPKAPLTPNDVIAGSPADAWVDILAEDLLVMQLSNARRVVIQLAPQFAPVHVSNIRILARAKWWDGAGVYRVQDNYVAQWGQGETEKPMPKSVIDRPAHEYWRSSRGIAPRALGSRDPYAPGAGYWQGWPVSFDVKQGWAALPHCYGYVGVARGLAPDTGTGGELYAIIGHAPRQLDRNIAVVGRVIEGIEHLSSLPRGSEALGFYKDKAQHVPVVSAELASELPQNARPRFQHMAVDSPSFGQYLHLRGNRSDDFYEVPAGGVDLCNAPVPIRKAP